MAKRYYWLKLQNDFFRQKPIKKLRKIAGGDTYTIIYLKMQLLSLKNEGKLYFEGVEESLEEELALELDEDPENVKVTVSFLKSCGLLEVVDTDEYMLTDVPSAIGSETESALRMRKCRDNKNRKILEEKTSHCDSSVTDGDGTVTNGYTEIDIEIEKEKDIYKTICPEMNSGQPQPKVEIEPVAGNGTKVETEPSRSRSELMVETEPAQADVFMRLPLINGDDYIVTRQYVSRLQESYPAVDVEQEIREMREWIDANPKNRKTPRGIKRFITGWLSREQDRAPRKTGETQNGAKNRFNNFRQREYDYGQLERQLLTGKGGADNG
ncbi:MAG TPA: phage replisome organizer N-terminal domain-containing protein [Candidatus Choladousia intestinigallinarum]|nr:phage replisome organizer N-terminal domain-containing protein [Candidatus Choladousia intestinigallinarum]